VASTWFCSIWQQQSWILHPSKALLGLDDVSALGNIQGFGCRTGETYELDERRRSRDVFRSKHPDGQNARGLLRNRVRKRTDALFA
jgi:hypothetical protein